MVNFRKNLGLKLAAIWLIVMGLRVFVPQLAFNGIEQLMAALAVAAGILILLDR